MSKYKGKPVYHLGANLKKRPDKRNIKFGNYRVRAELKEAPKKVVWDGICARRAYDVFGNYDCGNCAYAAPANLVVGAAANNRDPVQLSASEVIRLYEDGTGYDHKTGDNDNGAIPEEVLKQLSRLPEDHPMHVVAWGQVDILNPEEMRMCCNLFGGIYMGFMLPLNSVTDIGGVWDFRAEGNFYPGSWGGHAVMVRFIDYSKKKPDLRCITWGKQQKFTEKFLLNYASIGYFMITKAWLDDQTNLTPSGFDLARLLDDVERLKND